MNGKLKVLIGLGIGYVLGTRAGRERYEQITAQAQRFIRDPRVQKKAAQARDVAAEKAGDAVHAAKGKVNEKRGTDEPTTGLGAGMPGPDAEASSDRDTLGTTPETPNGGAH